MASASVTAVQELATVFTFDAKTGDIQIAEREVSRLRRTISGLSTTADRAERSMAGMGRRLVAVLGGALLARRFFESNRELERLEVTMRSVSGSAIEANENFRFILDWAARTPFDIRQVTRSFVALRAQGIQPTLDMFNGIGNLSSALGSDFSNLILAAQRAAQGRTQRLQQAILAPVSLSNNGRTLTVMFRGIAHEVDVAENGTQRVLELLAQIGNDEFGGQMTALINRLDGAMSNFGDILDIVFFQIGSKSGLNSAIVDLVQALTLLISKTKGVWIAFGRFLTIPLRALNWLMGEATNNTIAFNRGLTLLGLVLGTLATSAAVYWFTRMASAIFFASRAALALHMAFLPLTAAIIVIEDVMTFFAGGDSVFGRWTKDVGALGRAARSLRDILAPLFGGDELDLSGVLRVLVRAADTFFSEIVPLFWAALSEHMPDWMRRLLTMLGVMPTEPGPAPPQAGSGDFSRGEMGSVEDAERNLAAAREALAAARQEEARLNDMDVREYANGNPARAAGLRASRRQAVERREQAVQEVNRLLALSQSRRAERVRAVSRRARDAPFVERDLARQRSAEMMTRAVSASGFSVPSGVGLRPSGDFRKNYALSVGQINVDLSGQKLEDAGAFTLTTVMRNAVRQALNDVADDIENRSSQSAGVIE